eukprot:c27286_g1_i1.p1 GENE.c27286_g1_i1~~c27286_g1_i1.p1  ORF type:complete len:290 (+),score=93.23 c27286_g1_i1:45-872(+)
MALFKDFGKAGKDLLTKEFNAAEQKVELKSSTSDVSFDSSWSSSNLGKVETDFKLPRNSNVEFKLETDSNVTATYKIRELFPRTLFSVKATTSQNFNLGTEYRLAQGTTTADLEFSPSSGPLLHASALFNRNNYSAGGKVSLFAGDELRVKEYSVGLGFAKDSVEITGSLSENTDKKTAPQALFQFIHNVNPNFSYAARFTRTLEGSSKTSTEVGGQYKLNESSTVGAKLNQSAQLGLFALHKLNSNATLTQSFSLNVSQTSQPYQYGFALKFKY